MKDFREKDLYSEEQGQYNTFLEKKFLRYEDYDRFDTGEEDEDVDGMDDFSHMLALGDNDSFGGFESIMSGTDFSDSGFGGYNPDGTGEKIDYNSWSQDTELNVFLKSPLYLTNYVFGTMLYNKKDEETGKVKLDLKGMKDLFKYTTVAGGFLIASSILGYTIGFNNLHNNSIGLIFGASSILAGDFFNWRFFNQGLLAKFKPNENPKADEIEADNSSFGDDMFGEGNNFDFGDLDSSLDDSSDFGDDFGDDLKTLNLFGDIETEDEFVIDNEEFEYDKIGSDLDDDSILGRSDIPATKDSEIFGREVVQSYIKNSKYRGIAFRDKKSTLDSFAELLVNNDKKFATWQDISDKSQTFKNIAYTLYKALVDINPKFKSDTQAKLMLKSVKSSPLLYKIEMKLPQSHFKASRILKSLDVFENYLKKDASDTQVMVSITPSGEMYTVRLIKLDYTGMVSIGDILRYKDDSGSTAYQQMIDPKNLTPMLVGLRDNEYPHVVDLQKNTAMAIVGGSGSGKSWLTYELGLNLVVTNSYNDVNMIVMDRKNSLFWQTFSRMPHVIGYHAPDNELGIPMDKYYENLIKVTAEVVAEANRRQSMFKHYDSEDAVEFRKKYGAKKDYETLNKLPLLVLVIDEITTSMNEIKEMGKEEYDTFRANLNVISQVGRSAGVRLLTIGQRSIDTSLPKNVKGNTSLKFGMKMDAPTDFYSLFEDKMVEDMPKPQTAGLGIIKSGDVLGIHSLKTLIPGGDNEEQIRMVLRAIAFDWIRRAEGVDDLYAPPEGTEFEIAYNRPRLLAMSEDNIEKGNILADTIYSPETLGLPYENIKNKNVMTEDLVEEFESNVREESFETKPLFNAFEDEPEESEDVVTYSGKDFENLFGKPSDIEDEEDEEDYDFSGFDPSSMSDSLQDFIISTPIPLEVDDYSNESLGEFTEGDLVETKSTKEVEDNVNFNHSSELDFSGSEEELNPILDFNPEDFIVETVVDSEPFVEDNDSTSDFVEQEKVEEMIVPVLEEIPVVEEPIFEESEPEMETVLEPLEPLESLDEVSEQEEQEEDVFDLFDLIEDEDEVFEKSESLLAYEKEQELKELELREQELLAQELRKQEMRAHELREQETQALLREQQLKEKELEIKRMELAQQEQIKKLEQKEKEQKEALLRMKEEQARKESLRLQALEKQRLEATKQTQKVVETPQVQAQGLINVGYKSSAVPVSQRQPKMELIQFVLEKGATVSQFERAIPKEELQREYTKAEINKALRFGDIIEAKDAYIGTI